MKRFLMIGSIVCFILSVGMFVWAVAIGQWFPAMMAFIEGVGFFLLIRSIFILDKLQKQVKEFDEMIKKYYY